MPDDPRAVLRVDPETLPQLRALFAECIDLLSTKLANLERHGHLHEPWMYDPVSIRMRDVYNASVMDAPDGGYAALRAYEAELVRVHQELGRMEAEYRRTEDENAVLFRDRA